jgi:outer membrane autotransporter barrel domain protein
MKKNLLITTALVAVLSTTSAYAESLPSDASNLTTGKYVVEDTGQENIHNGNIKLSEEASLEVNTYVDIDAEQDKVTDTSHIFNVQGNLEVGDATNGGGSLSVKRDDDKKPFMSVNGNLTVNNGASVDMSSNSDYFSTITVSENADIKGGNVKMNNAEIFVRKGLSITGGNLELQNNGGLYLPEETSSNVTISGGKITMNGNTEIDTSKGDITISGGEINLKDASSIKTRGGNINISDGTITTSYTGNGDGEVMSLIANGNVEISGGTVNLNSTTMAAFGGKMNITGGNITLKGTSTNEASLWSAAGDLDISGADTVINMQGHADMDSIDDRLNVGTHTKNNINITDATINISGTENEIGAEGSINLNNATLNVADAGEVLVSNSADKKQGTLNLNGGLINLGGTINGNVNGNGNLCFRNAAATVSGNVSGSNLAFETDHSLSKAVSGTIGDLASLSVNKGTLTYDKQTGTIGNLNVAGGLDIGTNTVNATAVDFKDNSKLALRVAAADNYGKINADNITIGDKTTMNVTLDNGVVGNGKTSEFKFLNGTVNGDFTNKIAENNRYAIEWTEDGSLNITGTATASDVVNEAGGSTNNAKTAEAWDSLTSSSTASAGAKAVASVLNDLSQNNEQAYVEALTAVAPEVAPMVQKTQTETANQVFGAVSTRLTGGSVSTGGEGMSSGDNIFERAAMWVQGLFNHSKLDDTSKAKGFDADTNGIAFGFEKFVTDDVKAGIGYAYSNTDIDGFKRDTDVDTHTAILYGEYKPSNWYVNGIATYGWSDYDESKNVAGIKVNADYDVETFGLQAMTGYDMNIKGINVTPETGLRYVHIKQDAYKDSADQRVSANDSDILTGVIGAKVSKSWELSNGMTVKPEARIAATYDLFNDDVNSVVTLANGSAYAVDGEALDRFGMEFGAGVTAEFNDNVELSLGYEGKFREDYQDHTGLINAKYKF